MEGGGGGGSIPCRRAANGKVAVTNSGKSGTMNHEVENSRYRAKVEESQR